MNIKKRALFYHVALILFLLCGMVVSFTPLLWMFLSAFKSAEEILRTPPTWIPETWLWQNFVDVLKLVPLLLYMRNSLIVTSIITVGNLILSSLAGYALAKLNFPGRDKIFLLIVSTMMIPSFLFIIPQFITVKYFGWLNTWIGIIVPALASPFNTFLFRQFVAGIPADLLDAARMDGCNEFHVWWRIVLPLCKPVLATIGIITFFFGWDNFLWPFLVLQSSELYTLPIGLRLLEMAAAYPPPDYNLMMAGFVISVIPVLVVFIIAQRQIVQGITVTGMKA